MKHSHLDQNNGTYVSARIDNRRPAATTPFSIAQEVGPVVYFIRTFDDLIKVGHTIHLHVRKARLTGSWENLLAIRPGTREDEADLHAQFRPWLDHGLEYYRPNMDILSVANEIRADYGIPPVEPWF